MSLTDLDVHEGELRLIPGWDEEVAETLRVLKASTEDPRPRMVDTTMLYAPRSGGVKRYLLSKKAWLEANRPGIAHSLVVPGAHHEAGADGIIKLHATKLPFGDGYRWPSSVKRWGAWVASMKPSLIEAGDPYTPGQGALEAGQRAGCPVVGFCHSDPAGLAALHFGEWAKKPVEKRWARLFGQFDRVISPSRFIARRLEEAGIKDIVIRPLGVEIDTFRPDRGDRELAAEEAGPARQRPPAVLRRSSGAREEHRCPDRGRPETRRSLSPGPGRGRGGDARRGSRHRPAVRARPQGGRPDHRQLRRLRARQRQGAVRPDRAGGHGLRPPGGRRQRRRRGRDGQRQRRPAGSKSADPGDYAQAIEALFARDIEAIGAAARVHTVETFAWNRVFEGLCMTYGEVSGRPEFVQPGEELAVH